MLTENDERFIGWIVVIKPVLLTVGIMGFIAVSPLILTLIYSPESFGFDREQMLLVILLVVIGLLISLFSILNYFLLKKFLNIINAFLERQITISTGKFFTFICYLNKFLILVFILGLWRFLIFLRLYLESGRPVLKDSSLPIIPSVLGIYGLVIGIICILFCYLNRKFLKIINKISPK